MTNCSSSLSTKFYELWFKLALFEMDSVLGLLKQDPVDAGLSLLDRVGEIFRVLIQPTGHPRTMTPVEFNQFRSHLHPASGSKAGSFAEFELLAGADPTDYSKFANIEPSGKSASKKKRGQRASLERCL